MKLSALTEVFRRWRRKGRGDSRRVPRPRRRYRVDIVNENSLSRVWGVRLTGLRAVAASVAVIAAVASLIVMIFMFTPAGYLLPGSLRPAERGDYAELSLRIDSLSRLTAMQAAYTSNIRAILTDSTAPARPEATLSEPLPPDSLLEASEAERRFVQRFEQEERFNLSVLSPIAAEGMVFEAPAASDGIGPVAAIYRGTVISCFTGADGRSAVTVQHPNDFISVYGNLRDTYVAPGQKVSAGQRVGQTAAGPLLFELWHSGSQLDAAQYIASN